MTRAIVYQFGGDTGEQVLASIAGLGKWEVMGPTVPTDNTEGYAKGCRFTQNDGGVGTTLYVNEGTNLLCDFNAVT